MMKNLFKVAFLLIVCLSGSQIAFSQETQSVTAAQDECFENERIIRFRIQNRGAASSIDWKVVVGRTINYKASKGSSDPWGLGSGDCTVGNPFVSFWDLSDFDGEKGKEGRITTNPLPQSNEAFGSSNGTIQVSVPAGNPTCENKDGGIAIAEVFFEKDLTTNPEGVDPNWFFYWKQLLAFNSITFPIYNVDDPDNPILEEFPIDFVFSNVEPYAWDPGNEFLYGTANETPTFFPILGDPDGNSFAGSYSPRITFGEGCSKLCGHFITVFTDVAGNITNLRVDDGTGDTGIDCFNQVFYHEYEHLLIYRENWPMGRRTGDDLNMDTDEYSDQFEIANADAGFDIMVNDSYDNGRGSAGYDYEEERCRNVEDNLPNNLSISNGDWSFDPTNVYQGKNWKQ